MVLPPHEAGNPKTDKTDYLNFVDAWSLTLQERLSPSPFVSMHDLCPGGLMLLQSAEEARSLPDAWGDGANLEPLTDPSISIASLHPSF